MVSCAVRRYGSSLNSLEGDLPVCRIVGCNARMEPVQLALHQEAFLFRAVHLPRKLAALGLKGWACLTELLDEGQERIFMG